MLAKKFKFCIFILIKGTFITKLNIYLGKKDQDHINVICFTENKISFYSLFYVRITYIFIF